MSVVGGFFSWKNVRVLLRGIYARRNGGAVGQRSTGRSLAGSNWKHGKSNSTGFRGYEQRQGRREEWQKTVVPLGWMIACAVSSGSLLELNNESAFAQLENDSKNNDKDTAEKVTNTRRASGVRLRRANTNITSVDTLLMGYEYRLRETASLEKIFKYFASVVVDGEEYMTPLDLVRAVSPGVPPSPNSKPINIPLFEKTAGPELEFSEQEMPKFFKFGPDDSGLIDYQRFLVIFTLLTIPIAEIPVAYRMSTGEDFQNKKYRAKGLNVHNFDFIINRNIRRGAEYETEHEEGDLAYYLFGPELKKELTLEEFQLFHLNLRDEIERLQYVILSDKLDSDGHPIMSLSAFAKSVAALVPSDYRAIFLDNACRLHQEQVPKEVLDQEKRHGNISQDVENVTASCLTVAYTDYNAWQEVVRSLVQMEEAVTRYSYEDGHFTATNINRAAKAIANAKLTKAQIWVIFQLFDTDKNNELHHDEFARLLRPHSSTSPRYEAEGLGLSALFGCLRNCGRNWYEGTED